MVAFIPTYTLNSRSLIPELFHTFLAQSVDMALVKSSTYFLLPFNGLFAIFVQLCFYEN